MNQNNSKKIQLLAVLLIALPSTTVWAADSATATVEKLKQCAKTPETEARINCYEDLGKSVLTSDSQAADAQAHAESSQSPGAEKETENSDDTADNGLPDSLGGGKFADRAGYKAEEYRGRVTSCKQASDRKWFYIFENGQVWKQVDRRKRRHKDCNFDVSVIKDSFGYTMKIDGQDSSIRIDRRR